MKLSETVYYVIRHKESGEYLPSRMFRTTNRGTSYWKYDSTPIYDPTPKLFRNFKAAATTVGVWVKGTGQRVTVKTDIFGEEYRMEYTDLGRKRTDLEIIPVRIYETV